MEQIKYEKVTCVFQAGTKFFESERKPLPRGKCIGIAAFFRDSELPAGTLVELGIFDGGVEVAELTHVKSWEKSTAGTYLMGYRPFGFDCNRNVTVRAVSDHNLGTDFKFQVIFAIDTTPE